MNDPRSDMRDDRPQLRRNAWVFPTQKVAWVAIAKNACTSIKWMLADMAGEDPEAVYASTHAEVSRRMCIHDRELWTHVKFPSDLPPDTLKQVSPDNGWFVFTVVRDPRVRAWSAWQSKFLQREPIYSRKFPSPPWYPRLPTSQADVVEDFRTFVEWIYNHPRNRVINDPHFALQVDRIDSQASPYSKIYDIDDLGQLDKDLTSHLATLGIQHEAKLGRDNDTHLAISGRVFENGVREKLESIYARDLDRFGERWNFDKTMAKDPTWEKSAFAAIAEHAAMGQRIRDILNANAELRSERDEAQSNLSNLEMSSSQQLQQRVDSLYEMTSEYSKRLNDQKRQMRRLKQQLDQLQSEPSSLGSAIMSRIGRRRA